MRSKSGGRDDSVSSAQNGTPEYGWVGGQLAHDSSSDFEYLPTGALQIVRDISERKHTEQELEAAYHAAEALADQDALTGLANRRRLDEFLANEWKRGLRGSRAAFRCFCWMWTGSRLPTTTRTGTCRETSVSKQIADVARSVLLRTSDLAARYGGEEFALVLPFTPIEGARRIAEELCAAMRHIGVAHSSTREGIVTVSIGCATLVPGVGGSVQDLVEMADQALYKAKHEGRNRVCTVDGEGAAGHERGPMMELGHERTS